jgi:hypothetical protein
MQSIKSDNSKPVEKRGRKAKGLTSRPRDYDSQVAEDKNISTIFASLAQNQALFVGTLSFVRSIKANPLKDGDAKPRV